LEPPFACVCRSYSGTVHVAAYAQPMSDLVPPLFVAQPDALVILRDESGARNFEPWFPQEERYTAFDREGRRFELAVKATEQHRRLLPGKRIARTVVCRQLETAPTGAEDLVAILRIHLEDRTHSTPLSDLVEMIVQTYEYTW
jgi:hypothetical protein